MFTIEVISPQLENPIDLHIRDILRVKPYQSHGWILYTRDGSKFLVDIREYGHRNDEDFFRGIMSSKPSLFK